MGAVHSRRRWEGGSGVARVGVDDPWCRSWRH